VSKHQAGKPLSIDLFAGAGGLALGIHEAGFASAGLVEFNKHACETLRINADSLQIRAQWPVIESDARAVDYASLARSVDLLAGGAPCQPFSLGGKHRGDEDGRNMFPEVFRSLRDLRPKAVMLENVRGLTRKSFRPYFEYILAQLANPHCPPQDGEGWTDHFTRLRQVRVGADHRLMDEYDVRWRVINSADYGVPQKRERVIIVAFRRDLDVVWEYPEPTHSEDRLLYEQFVTGEYWSCYNLEPKEPSPRLLKRLERLASDPPKALPWQTLRSAIEGLPEPIANVPTSDWTFHIGIPGARLYKGHTGNDLDKPAKTIKAGYHGNPGGEHIILKDDGSFRYMTVRECARVQAFPDTYHFSGSRTEAMRQIGNAVPVSLARILAISIRDSLEVAEGSRGQLALAGSD
jgi:DNA (cytosine-5)-methyltransferase 1